MKKLHFIGIGGAGMAPLAQLSLESGIAVSGSDSAVSAKSEHLKSLGDTKKSSSPKMRNWSSIHRLSQRKTPKGSVPLNWGSPSSDGGNFWGSLPAVSSGSPLCRDPMAKAPSPPCSAPYWSPAAAAPVP